MSGDKNWYAIYTKPRWEKKVYSLLTEKGMEAYCPLNRVRKKWSDRIKMVEEPLFKSYVFVHIIGKEQPEVRTINGVLNFVYWLGKPAIVKPADIDRIKRFLNEYENVTVQALDLQPDDTVIVTSGALMEKEGKVLKRSSNTITIEIASLGYRLVAQVDKRNVVKVSS
jgi:transcription antitermination factor NusG